MLKADNIRTILDTQAFCAFLQKQLDATKTQMGGEKDAPPILTTIGNHTKQISNLSSQFGELKRSSLSSDALDETSKKIQELETQIKQTKDSIPFIAINSLNEQMKTLEERVTEVKESIPTDALEDLTKQFAGIKSQLEDIKKSIPITEIDNHSTLLKTLEENLNKINDLVIANTTNLERQISDIKESIPTSTINELTSQIKTQHELLKGIQLFFEKDSKQSKDFTDHIIELTKEGLKKDMELLEKKNNASIKTLELQVSGLKRRFDYCQKISVIGFSLIFALGAIMIGVKN